MYYILYGFFFETVNKMMDRRYNNTFLLIPKKWVNAG